MTSFRSSLVGGAILAVLFALTPGDAAAQAELTCERIVRDAVSVGRNEATEAGGYNLGANIAETFRSLILSDAADNEDEPAPVERDGYFITAVSGNALFIDCSTGLQRLVYFPVGQVLKAQFGFAYDGDAYIMGRTEHGLHLIFDRDWLVPVKEDDVFFVWTGFGRMPLCVAGSVSSGTCDPHVPTRDSEPLMEGSKGFVHARFDALAEYDVSRDYVDWLRSEGEQARIFVENPLMSDERANQYMDDFFVAESDEASGWRDGFCRPFNAGALYQNGKRPGETPDWSAVSLSLCERAPEAEALNDNGDAGDLALLRPRPVKIVTHAAAAEMHSPSVSMVFPNASDVSFSILIEARSLPDDVGVTAGLHTKECKETIDNKWQRELNALAQAGLNVEAVASFKTSVEAILKSTSTVSEQYGADEMFHTSAILILQDERSDEIDRVRDIRMVSVCEEETPVRLRTIIFEHPAVERNRIEIAASDLLSIYNLIAEERQSQGVEGITTDYGRQSDSQRREDAAIGVFWQIKDPNEYLLWRDTLRLALSRDRRISSIYYGDDIEDEGRHLQMLDHFTHVLMAAIFRSTYQPTHDRVGPTPPPFLARP